MSDGAFCHYCGRAKCVCADVQTSDIAEREAFEKWALDESEFGVDATDFSRTDDGAYLIEGLEPAWQAWKARAARQHLGESRWIPPSKG